MVDREQVRLQGRLPVHVEEHSPELTRSQGPVGDRFDHVDVARRPRRSRTSYGCGRARSRQAHRRALARAAFFSPPPCRRSGGSGRVRVSHHESVRANMPGRAEGGRDRRSPRTRPSSSSSGARAHGRPVVGRLAQAGVAARQRHFTRERCDTVAVAAVDGPPRTPRAPRSAPHARGCPRAGRASSR